MAQKTFLLQWLWILSAAAFVLGCTSAAEKDLALGKKEVSQGHFHIALSYFDRVLKREPNSKVSSLAAQEGVRVAVYQVKDYKKAAEYLKHLILNETSPDSMYAYQSQLADIYFENLNDYKNAYAEFNKILNLKISSIDRAKIQIKMAKSSFYEGDFVQAESEVDTALKNPLEPSSRFHALYLKGNILVSRKRYGEAAKIYEYLMSHDPELSIKENVPVQLAVCHEEDGRFADAIKVLELLIPSYKPKEYIELRIKRLKEKMKNQPGARGLHK